MDTPSLSRSGRLTMVGALSAATLLSWSATGLLMSDTSPGTSVMQSQAMAVPMTWSLGALAISGATWAVMMTGMMLPSTIPMTQTFAALSRRRMPGLLAAAHGGLFTGGYLAVWAAFSVVAAMLQQSLTTSGLMTGGVVHALLAGGVLATAGVYQLTPAKSACLRRCRTPLGFLLTEWRDGAGGSAVMGLRHGLWCLGCCLPLMLVLFGVGVMNLVWMAALAAVVLAEKVLPFGVAVGRATGLGLIGYAVWVLARLGGIHP